MSSGVKYRDVLREIAYDNYGYVTTAQAREEGVPGVELPKLAARGGLTHVAYGLYRVVDIPRTELDQYAEALLRAGQGSYLHGRSVLALHDLADLNLRYVEVATPRRARPQTPPFMKVTWRRQAISTTLYFGLRSQWVADALVECRTLIEPQLLAEATRQARAEGLVTAAELNRLPKELQ